jgi:hypothetical protein
MPLMLVTALLLTVTRADRTRPAVGGAGCAENNTVQRQYQRRNQRGSRFPIHPHNDFLMMIIHGLRKDRTSLRSCDKQNTLSTAIRGVITTSCAHSGTLEHWRSITNLSSFQKYLAPPSRPAGIASPWDSVASSICYLRQMQGHMIPRTEAWLLLKRQLERVAS